MTAQHQLVQLIRSLAQTVVLHSRRAAAAAQNHSHQAGVVQRRNRQAAAAVQNHNRQVAAVVQNRSPRAAAVEQHRRRQAAAAVGIAGRLAGFLSVAYLPWAGQPFLVDQASVVGLQTAVVHPFGLPSAVGHPSDHP